MAPNQPPAGQDPQKARLRVQHAGPLAVLQTRRGVVPDAQSHWVLPRLLGTARAAELLIAGRTITGAQAAAWGLANEAVDAASVLTTALHWASDIATNVSPLSAAMSKRIMWRGLAEGPDAVDTMERDAHIELMGLPDALEGGRAFVERRRRVDVARPRRLAVQLTCSQSGSRYVPKP